MSLPMQARCSKACEIWVSLYETATRRERSTIYPFA
jgi:hypothetical protein